jgi:hypothetical protein
MQHVPDPVLAGKASPATCATLMPCADHNTICARHVTTDPKPRPTIRFRRLPSSSLISRTRTRPAIPASVTPVNQHKSAGLFNGGSLMPARPPPGVSPFYWPVVWMRLGSLVFRR